MAATPLLEHVCGRLTKAAPALTRAWLDALSERLALEPRRILPTETMLDHVPQLLERSFHLIGQGISVRGNEAIEGKLRDLARLRRLQGFEATEIVAEFEILSGIVTDAFRAEVDKFGGSFEIDEALAAFQTLHQTFVLMARVSASYFDQAGVGEQTERAELLREYSRTVNHELRNGINAAVLQVELAREALEQGDLERVAARLASTDEAVRHLSLIGTDTQALSLAEGEGAQLVARRVALPTLIEDCADLLHDYAQEYGVVVRIVGDIPYFQVDGARLQLALVNLINNSIKYSRSEVADSHVEIRVEPADEDRHWWIVVSDNGRGIHEDAIERIFSPGMRANRQKSGSGLGLSIARRAVEQCGGRLWAEPSAEGARFVIEISEPLAALEETDD